MRRCLGCGGPLPWDASGNRLYCCESCGKRARRCKLKEDSCLMACPFNEAVECNAYDYDCCRCGWNPKVAAARKQELEERYGTV